MSQQIIITTNEIHSNRYNPLVNSNGKEIQWKTDATKTVNLKSNQNLPPTSNNCLNEYLVMWNNGI